MHKPTYPFYGMLRTFYDQPMWSPVGKDKGSGLPPGTTLDIFALRWEAHTYAIKKYSNILYVIGAIKWGYNFFHSEYYPRFVFLEPLDGQVIREDIDYLMSMSQNLEFKIMGENIDRLYYVYD